MEGQDPQQAGKPEKMWTDGEVDSYVKARIDKQSSKHAAEIAEKDARIAELEAASKEAASKVAEYEHKQQLSAWAKQVSEETGIPESILRGESLEAMQEHAAAIKGSGYVAAAYPNVNPAAVPKSTSSKPSMTKQDIMSIRDAKQRHAAIEANPDLFPELK